jgi:hypothetical protein
MCDKEETQNHFLQCTGCDKRRTIRNQFLSDIRSYLQQSYLNHSATHVIITCIGRWLEDTDIPTLVDFQITDDNLLSHAYNEQCEIGWDQWFRGPISSKWGEIYSNDITTHVHQTRNTQRLPPADKWAEKWIVKIYDFVRSEWTLRNEEEQSSSRSNCGAERKTNSEDFVEQNKSKILPK